MFVWDICFEHVQDLHPNPSCVHLKRTPLFYGSSQIPCVHQSEDGSFLYRPICGVYRVQGVECGTGRYIAPWTVEDTHIDTGWVYPPNETIALCRASHALTRKYSSSITHSLQVNPCGALLLCGTTSCFCGGTYLDIRFGCGHRNTLIPTLKFSTMFAGILELYKMCPMETALYEAHGL